MSKQIDERVVSMQFDNKHFEANVRTSMSTIERLKQALNFKNAGKGLENLSASVKNVDMNSLGNGVDAVKAKFSALQVMGVTALANLTNSAVNAGKRIATALTIEPIKTGLQEYETQINAVQTILANTSHAGTTLEDVNGALDTLNTYADKTIYNFTEMTRNIGTFTAAGVDLETSVNAIQGIANLAAVSGSTSQQASTAMYQLSQALAAGKVSLMDWNSVVNAGMGGKVFQDALIRTSELLGTGAKKAIDTYGSFRESLTRGEWLTTEVLIETLETFTGNLSEKELALKGYSKTQIEEIIKMGKTAQDAATKVKTYTQLMDTVKESIQSGWTQTWEILIGDFEEAKSFWTGISDFLTGDNGIITKMSNARNTMLEGAMTSNWDKLIKKVNEAGVSTTEFEDKLVSLAEEAGLPVDKLIEDYGSLENAFQSGKISSDILKKAMEDLKTTTVDLSSVTRELKWGDTGEDVKKVQEALTKLGYELPEYGVDGLIKDETTAAIKAFQAAEGLQTTGIVDEETLAALEKACTLTGKLEGNIDDLIDGITELGGRELLIEGLKNIFEVLMSVVKPIGKAFREIFPATTSEQLYGLIDGFHTFTEKLSLSKDTINDIQNTFKGLFAIVDIIAKVVGGTLKFAFEKLIGPISGASGGILKITGNIGEAISGFRDWIVSNDRITKGIQALADVLVAGAEHVRGWIDAFLQLPEVQNAIDSILDKLSNFKQIGLDAIEGLKNGLVDGIKSVPQILFEIGKAMLAAIKGVLGIHSPSKEMEEVGENAIQGLINGIMNLASGLWDTLTKIGDKLVGFFKSIPWDKIFAFGVSTSMIVILYKLIDALNSVGEALGGFGNIMEEVGDGIKRVSKAQATKLRSEALKNMAISIGILAVALIALAQVPWQGLVKAGAALIVLAGVLIGLSFAMNKLNEASVTFSKKGGLNISGLKSGLIGIGIAVLLLAGTVALIGKLDKDEAIQGFLGLAGVIVALVAFLHGFGKAVDGKQAENIDKLGKMLKKLSVSLLLMIAVIKLISFLDASELGKGALFMAGFTIFIAALSKVTKGISGDADKLGSLILKVSFALGLMVGVVKLIDLLEYSEMGKGVVFCLGFAAFVKALIWSTKVGKDTELAKIGGLILSVSTALLLMVGVCKLVGLLSTEDLIKGGAFVAAFVLLIKSMLNITKVGTGQQIGKVGGTILAMSLAIGIMAGVSVLLGMINIEYLAKGIVAVGMLSALMAMMIKASRGANDVKGNLVVMTVAIGLMAASVAALSLIDTKDLATSTAAMVSMMAGFALMISSAKKLNGAKGVIGNLVVMTGIMLVMAGIVAILSEIDNPDIAIKNSAALAVLMASLSVAMKLASTAGKDASSAVKNMAAMTLVVGGLALILGSMSALDVEASIPSATALSILVNAMATAMLILSKVKMGDGASLAKSIIGLTAMLIPLSVFALALNYIPMDNIAGKEEALLVLAGVMSAMTVLMLAVSAVGSISTKMGGGMVGGILGLTAMCGVLSGFAWALNAVPMDTISGKKDSIILLTGVMTVLTGLLLVTSAVGAIYGLTGGIAATGLLGLIGILYIFTEFAEALNAINMDSIAQNKETILLITDVMRTLTDMLLQVSLVAPLAVIAVAAMSGFAGLIIVVGTIATIVGAIMEKHEQFRSFLETGLQVMIQVANGLGEMIGAFVNSALTTIAEGLPNIGTQLSNFMTNVTPFIEGAKLVDESVVNGVKALAGAVIALTAADLISGIASLLPFSSSLAEMGTSLSQFAMNALPFLMTSRLIDESSMNGVKALAEAILIITASSLLEQINSWVSGSSSMTTFSSQLATFGDAIVAFSTKVKGNVDEGAVMAAANAGKAIAELYNALPKTGGWMQTMFGEQNIATFSSQLATFGYCITNFSTKVKGNIDETAVTAATNAGKTIAGLYEALPKGGGWMQEIFGETNLTTFGTQLVSFGDAITGFSAKVKGKVDEGAVTAAASAGRVMAELANSLPKDGSIWDIFSSEDKMNFETFGRQLGLFATALTNFSSKISEGFEDAAVTSAASATTKLIDLFKSMTGIDTENVDTFRDAVKSLGKAKVEKFYESFTASKAENASSAVRKIVNLIKSMAGMDASGVGTFKKALKELSTVEITSFVKAFSSAATKLAKAGTDMMTGFVKGIKSKSSTVNSTIASILNKMYQLIKSNEGRFGSAGQALATRFVTGLKAGTAPVMVVIRSALMSAVAAINACYSSFYNGGVWLGQGLVDGISSQVQSAYNAGYRLGAAAAQGEKDGQKSNSPSKLTIQNGKWLGEGLIIGINKMGNSVYKAGYNMGETATESISGAISKVVDFLDSDMDTQPTIRPVVDLTNVTDSANRINSIFGTNQSIGLMTNVGAISSMMSSRSQNGVNDDVVNAINKLRADIDNMPRNTYTVGGITYDDGSNVANAVESLIRAVTIERRR